MKLIALLMLAVIFSGCQQIYFALATITTAEIPTQWELKTPKSEPINFSVESPNTITILLYKNDGVYAYSGKNITEGKKYTYKQNSIRSFLKERKSSLKDKLFVLIKTSSGASYKNTVDMLDEMTINDIKKYSMPDISSEEEKYLKSIQ